MTNSILPNSTPLVVVNRQQGATDGAAIRQWAEARPAVDPVLVQRLRGAK